MSAAIEVDNLTVQYGENAVLNDVSFTIETGESVGIIGPNGSGKSTLLKALLGLVPHDSGNIRLLGNNPENLAANDLGYIPQIRRVDASFPALAIEVVVAGIRGSWPARIHPPERETALEALGKTGAALLAERPVASLSGGEWQRVHLARCLARRPKLLLLDEPASGLDVLGQGDFYHLLEAFREETGATVLMVTHDWEGVRAHADEVLLVHSGKVSRGAPEELTDERALLELFGHTGHVRKTHGNHGHA